MIARSLRLKITYAALALVCLCLVGCGYFSYHAYYIQPDGDYQTETDRFVSGTQRFTGFGGSFDVIFVLQRPLEKNNRECFVASVWLTKSAASISDTSEANDQADIVAVPEIDSIVIASQSSHEQFVLRTSREIIDENGTRFDSERICLNRRHKRITIQFTASMKDTTQRVLATDFFEIDLERWEDRNWLGLE